MDSPSPVYNTIGYFFLSRLKEKCGYVGAMLIVNNEGIPQEFKCTESIKPTPVQQSLYGEKMELYIAVKLCAIPLLEHVSKKPDVLFVNEQDLLMIREDAVVPVLFIQATKPSSDNLPPVIILNPRKEYNEPLLQEPQFLFDEEDYFTFQFQYLKFNLLPAFLNVRSVDFCPECPKLHYVDAILEQPAIFDPLNLQTLTADNISEQLSE